MMSNGMKGASLFFGAVALLGAGLSSVGAFDFFCGVKVGRGVKGGPL